MTFRPLPLLIVLAQAACAFSCVARCADCRFLLASLSVLVAVFWQVIVYLGRACCVCRTLLSAFGLLRPLNAAVASTPPARGEIRTA